MSKSLRGMQENPLTAASNRAYLTYKPGDNTGEYIPVPAEASAGVCIATDTVRRRGRR